jgi:Ger(x)C family germination protein
MLKKILVIGLALSLVFTSGCWDNIELDERTYTTSLFVDLNEEADRNKSEKDVVFDEDVPKKLRVTFGFIDPSKAQGGEGAFVPRTIQCASLADAVDVLGEETSRAPFFAHIQLLVFTEKMLKDPETFKEALDKLERSPNLNQLMQVAVVNIKQEDFFAMEPKLESTLSAYVTGILRNSKRLSDTLSVTLSELCSTMRSSEGAAVLPFIDLVKKGEREEFKIEKGVLIRDYKFDRYLESEYIETYKIMNGKLKGGLRVTTLDGNVIPIKAYSGEQKIEVRESEDKFIFDVKVAFEADIEQNKFGKNTYDSEFVKKVQKRFEEVIKDEFTEATRYFQKEVGFDYLGFKDYTAKYNNKLFKKYEKNWEEAFKNADINYEVKVNIRRIGTSKGMVK